jgi:hypothetical protein
LSEKPTLKCVEDEPVIAITLTHLVTDGNLTLTVVLPDAGAVIDPVANGLPET